MANFLTSDGGVSEANTELEKAQRANTGVTGARKATDIGTGAAISAGQSAGQSTANAATSMGATKGQAEALASNTANAATAENVASKTAEAAKANQEEIANKEKKLQEAEAAQAEQLGTVDKIGAVNNALGTTALTAAGTAFGGPVGGAIGAGLGSAVNAGRQLILDKWGDSDNKWKRGAARLGSVLLSDERLKVIEERCGYKSKIKKPALLELRRKDEQ